MTSTSAIQGATRARAWLWVALALLVSAYVQGGIDKATDFPAAVAEMRHFGLEPAAPMALATIAVELGASALILTGWMRWLGAVLLAAFTLGATFMANKFWLAPPADRFTLENAFFEHLGLVGAFVLVAWIDLQRPSDREPHTRFVPSCGGPLPQDGKRT